MHLTLHPVGKTIGMVRKGNNSVIVPGYLLAFCKLLIFNAQFKE